MVTLLRLGIVDDAHVELEQTTAVAGAKTTSGDDLAADSEFVLPDPSALTPDFSPN